MKKLLEGIIRFRETVRPQIQGTFARLALGQKPDALYIGCSDSRVAVNVFASTDPGDLFVTRNVGNLVPTYLPGSTDATAAVIEFAVFQLQVSHIIVCGHSECGAMNALLNPTTTQNFPAVRSWLHHASDAHNTPSEVLKTPATLTPVNQISQANVIAQMEHLRSYPEIRSRESQGLLQIHGWWFDLSAAEVYTFETDKKGFVLIDSSHVEHLRNKTQ